MPTRKKEFFIEGKQEITDPNAPVVSDEFVYLSEEGTYQGQTITVQSDTKLEDDNAVGKSFIMRTFEFVLNPETKAEWIKTGQRPSNQEIFNAHVKGITSYLWLDGLQPAMELDPQVVFSNGGNKYLILVWATPMTGGEIDIKGAPVKTLKEVFKTQLDDTRTDKNKVQRELSVSPTKKKKASGTA